MLADPSGGGENATFRVIERLVELLARSDPSPGSGPLDIAAAAASIAARELRADRALLLAFPGGTTEVVADMSSTGTAPAEAPQSAASPHAPAIADDLSAFLDRLREPRAIGTGDPPSAGPSLPDGYRAAWFVPIEAVPASGGDTNGVLCLLWRDEQPRPLDPAALAAIGAVLAAARRSRMREAPRASREAIDKLRTLSRIVPGVSHELNNRFAGMIALGQLMALDRRLPDERREDAARLIREAERAQRLARGLLEFARERPPERVPTEVRLLVESVLELLSDALTSGRIEVDLETAPDLPPVEIDRPRLQLALLQVLLEASQPGQRAAGGTVNGRLGIRVALGTGARTEAIRIEVIGNAPESLPLADTLDASIAATILADHGGRIFSPPIGRKAGPTVVIELPVRVGDEGAPGERFAPAPVERDAPDAARLPGNDDRPGESAPPAPAPGPAPADDDRPRVLVLDDDESIRVLMARALRLRGFDPLVTADGAEALDELRRRSFDVLLVDHRMAGMDGIEFHRRASQIRPDVPGRVVFMSGDSQDPELLRFAAANGARVLAKPFELGAVARLVTEVLERQGRLGG